jgi:hypothetical protein
MFKDWFDRLRVNRMHIKRMLRIGEAAAGNAGITSLLTAAELWNPADILDGDMVAVDIAVTGAALGDKVLASFSLDLTDLQLTADVTAADVVTAVLSNSTGGAVNLAEGTLSVLVVKTAAAGHNQ